MTDKGTPPKYEMTLSLNVLNHLGLGLYSNVPAVLSEAVANAWDADATKVVIDINKEKGSITIQDDGHGMSVSDANKKYLHVGYERRKLDGAKTPELGRIVMGRKGIGKLSLFSIAKVIEIHSIKGSEKHGFRIDVDKIKRVLEEGNQEKYKPEPVPVGQVQIHKGTKIILTDLKRQLRRSRWLRRRLARRFSIFSLDFNVVLNGEPVRIEDRDYYDKLQYIWTFGECGKNILSSATTYKEHEQRSGVIDLDHRQLEIDGWIGTAHSAGQLKDTDTNGSINKIGIMFRGKLAQEDILEEFGEGGVYSKYLIGEIHAEFLDRDEEEDIATTSRQHIIEDDPRYEALRVKIREELKHIQKRWTDLRNEGGTKRAIEISEIKQWFRRLTPDHQEAARRLFGKIYQLPIDDSGQMKQLLISGILAFESLKLRGLLNRI